MAGIVTHNGVTLVSPDGLTEKLVTIDNSGNPLFDGGQLAKAANPTFTGLITTAGQIKFPATQAASSDPNTLDDYEEGTFTPVAVGTTTAGVGTYTGQTGFYTRVGNIVTVLLHLTWTAHTGDGNLTVAGLPFACGTERSVPNLYAITFSIGSGKVVSGFVSSGGTSITIVGVSQTSGSVTFPQLPSTATIRATLIYLV